MTKNNSATTTFRGGGGREIPNNSNIIGLRPPTNKFSFMKLNGEGGVGGGGWWGLNDEYKRFFESDLRTYKS